MTPERLAEIKALLATPQANFLDKILRELVAENLQLQGEVERLREMVGELVAAFDEETLRAMELERELARRDGRNPQG